MRPVRLPLQVGSSSLWRSVVFALCWLPMLATFLYGFRDFDYLDFDALSLLLLSLAVRAVAITGGLFGLLEAYALREDARRMRASDALLDGETLRIVGGARDGLVLRFDDPALAGVTLEARPEPRWPYVYIVTGRDLGTREVLRLVLPGVGGAPATVLAEAFDAAERDSLRALHDTLQAVRAAPVREDQGRRVADEVVRCPGCAAPQPARDADEAGCAHCGAVVRVPADLRARLAAHRLHPEDRARYEALIARLLRQPGARAVNRVAAAVGMVSTLTWPAAGLALYALHHAGTLTAARALLLVVAVPLGVLSLAGLLRRLLAERAALRLFALAYGAAPPPAPAAPPSCRSCAAPLDAGGDAMLARCGYCGTDNLLGLDLRPVADPLRAQRTTLEAALVDRRRQRARWTTLALASGAGCAAAIAAVVAAMR